MEGRFLIWGEFPPKTISGISLSNGIVRRFLEARAPCPLIIEEYSWRKGPFRKVFHILRLYCRLVGLLSRYRLYMFYFSFPLSVFGLIKFQVPLLLVRIFSRKTRVMAHLHRGSPPGRTST